MVSNNPKDQNKAPAKNSQIKNQLSSTARVIAKKSQAIYRKAALQKPIGRSMDAIKKVRSSSALDISKDTKPTDSTETTSPQPKASAVETATTANTESPTKPIKKHRLRNSIIIIAIGLMAIGSLVYIYMPAVSLAIANTRSGVNATLPEYLPDGYSIQSPVKYKKGEVTTIFYDKLDKQRIKIIQSSSSWDSSAVKAKAEEDSGDKLLTTNERGLTIFSYGNNATWVNGGILYTITGDAPLSGDQIRRIATSL